MIRERGTSRFVALLLAGALMASLTACVDDPLLAPSAREGPPREEEEEEEEEEELSPVWFTGTPEITAAVALVDSMLATPHADLLVVLDGTILRPSSLKEIPRDLIRRAEVLRATSCGLYGSERETHVLLILTADWRRR
jgi:hypothetical protein